MHIFQWAIALRENEQYDQAVTKLEEVRQRHGESAWVYFELGKTQRAKGDYDTAIDQYKKATMIDPLMTVAYLSWCSLIIDRPHEEAIDEFVIAANQHQQNATPDSAAELRSCVYVNDNIRT